MPSDIRGGDNFDSGEAFGQNQTWQDVTASRAANTIYTNNTGKPITVVVLITSISTLQPNSHFYVNDVLLSRFRKLSTSAATYQGTHTTIVPNGSTYKIDAGMDIDSWMELR